MRSSFFSFLFSFVVSFLLFDHLPAAFASTLTTRAAEGLEIILRPAMEKEGVDFIGLACKEGVRSREAEVVVEATLCLCATTVGRTDRRAQEFMFFIVLPMKKMNMTN